MKSIKDLRIKTKEGLEVKNLQRFPSMEWGDEGGVAADIYLNNKYVGHLHQSGEGGSASFSGYTSENIKQLSEAGITFLKRVDKDYGEQSKYKWLQEKTAKTFDEDDIESIIVDIEERYDRVRAALKGFKEGYKAMAVMFNDHEEKYLFYRVADITIQEVKTHMTEHKFDKKYPDVEIITCHDDLTIL